MTDVTVNSIFAINSILDRVEPLAREIPGVIAGLDPECLHRMRVASRRLRTALRLQAAHAGMADARSFFRLIRSVTRTLGEARDLDVQIEWLKEFLGRCQTRERSGVNRLMLRLSQARGELQPRIIRVISNITPDPAFRDAMDRLRAARFDAEMSGAVTADADIQYATRVIGLQLDSVIQHSTSLLSRDAHEAHHRMRIEVKRLRYAMEIFRGVYGDKDIDGSLDEYAAIVKQLQALLGDLHDADVWVARIPVLSEAETERTEIYFGTPRPFSRLSPGYDAIANDRSAFREEQFEKTLDFWNAATKAGHWRSFRELLLRAYRGRINPVG
ncbi:MAG: CHAD domain-containing protein [Synergistaceae bacterium]|jgi:CHAD domain-containing protein|nr:CHAD domain-containing protein [Synergistaceae bacterium]